ncbi:MAG: AAA family ATPase [Planctomycetia bacterium]|nr:AAA family ATPase [Planctomycetia bacterium]
MYEKHFGLRRRPFRPTPDGDSYYPATGHEHALDRLLQGIDQDEGHLLLTGDPGSGKTLLCHRLLERLGADATSAFLTNSHLTDRRSLLQSILFELSLPYEGATEQEMRLRLTECLLENFQAGKRTVVVVDEAQHLGVEILEELRLLGNLEARHGKAVQIVLVAQPALMQTLQKATLTALRQRLAVRALLEPLGTEEAADYVLHQLRMVGGRPEKIIDDEALAIIARTTLGVPRLLNQATHQALLLACEMGATQVDAEAALEALTVLGMLPESVPIESAEGLGRRGLEDEEEEPRLKTPRRPAG